MVHAWVAAYNRALTDNDFAPVTALTHPACETCRALRSSIAEVHRSGGYFRGGQWRVGDAAVTGRSRTAVEVTTDITVLPGTSRSHADAPPERSGAHRFDAEFEITRGTAPAVARLVLLS